jgi:hypothetical protein
MDNALYDGYGGGPSIHLVVKGRNWIFMILRKGRFCPGDEQGSLHT